MSWTASSFTEDLASQTSDALARVRERKPLIHCVTNQVVMNFTANTLYALGASPLMSHAPEEAEELARLRAGLLINIGTLTAPWLDDVRRILAAEVAMGSRRAVLDPVGAGATHFRTEAALELLATGAFRVLRGNAFEILSLGGESARGQGVESFEESDAALHAARTLAQKHALVVAVSGAVDLVTDGERVVELRNGHSYFTKVTGAGCALNAVIAAMTSVTEDPWLATAEGIAVFNLAGEIAARESAGPGSFAVRFLDALANLSPAEIARGLRAELKFHHASTGTAT